MDFSLSTCIMDRKGMRWKMKRKFWFGLGGGVIVLALLILIIVLFVNPISRTTVLTEQEALNVAEQRYSGTVKQIQQRRK